MFCHAVALMLSGSVRSQGRTLAGRGRVPTDLMPRQSIVAAPPPGVSFVTQPVQPWLQR
jgi:hypothetical protein